MSETRRACAGPRPDARRPGLPLARVAWSALLVVVLVSPVLSQPIHVRNPTSQPSGAAHQTSRATDFSFTRVTLALGAVVSLIFAFRWGARRFVTGGAASGHSRAVQVISRTIVAPRQQLMLVKVGRRLVLVANTGAGMNALCEIRDEQEVADLLGQVSADKGDSVSRAFGSLFRREEEKFSPPSPPVTQSSEERIPTGTQVDGSPELAEVSATRDELSGLMDKVRLVSKQFRRS